MAGRLMRKVLVGAGVAALVVVVAKQYPAIKREVKIWLM